MVKINLNNKQEADNFYNKNKKIYQKLSNKKNLNLKNRLLLSKICLNMAFINEARNNICESIKLYSKSFKLNRCFRSSYSLGMIYYNQKEYDLSLKYLFESSVFNNESAFFIIAKIYYLKKDFKKCEFYLNKSAELGDEEALFILAKYYYNIKKYHKSLNFALKLIDNDIEELRNCSILILILINCQFKNKDKCIYYHEKLDGKFKKQSEKIIKSFNGEFFDFN